MDRANRRFEMDIRRSLQLQMEAKRKKTPEEAREFLRLIPRKFRVRHDRWDCLL
jgi:hypothetical protein